MAAWTTPWKVQLASLAEKDLKDRIKRGLISSDDVAVLKAWVCTIEEKGPDFVATTAAGHWNDHPLFGDRTGQRSSSFSDAGRIIYKVDTSKNVIEVLRVTEEHNYSSNGDKKK
ncbi:MAG: hypothetical protein HY537_13550 [Deltaproteobacteria bacterium]|nr:hypothetical protein [Deltaproteobacteria bacterium]